MKQLWGKGKRERELISLALMFTIKGSINRDNGNCQYNEQIAQKEIRYTANNKKRYL